MDAKWEFSCAGKSHAMPAAIEKAHAFFRSAVAESPFWKDDLVDRPYDRADGNRALRENFCRPPQQLRGERLTKNHIVRWGQAIHLCCLE
ncbi:hypothetical protein [Luteimonas salinilitoris]|uniref:Uncharacterized protein n=1 Tax=Luteimonas salinilitoris TaxID=3237697 RepID=A0ABV4HPC4_9GAMM